MTTNPKGYMTEYIAKLQMECAFLVTNGEMRTIDGELIKFPTSHTVKPDETVFHHNLELNGNRPSGKINRLLEIRENAWNVDAITNKGHKAYHWGRKD